MQNNLLGEKEFCVFFLRETILTNVIFFYDLLDFDDAASWIARLD